MNAQQKKLAYKISIKSMAMNLLLCVLKMAFGVIIKSASLVSDAIHSLSDIFSTLVVLIGIRISSKPADKTHPYGHEKIETVIAFMLGIMLFVIGGKIAYDGTVSIFTMQTVSAQQTLLNIGAIMVAVISILGKEWMYRFTIKCAKQIGSGAMRADAWHHRADALSSVGSLIGVVGLRLGFPIVDAIACLVISLFIFKAAYNIVSDAFRNIVDCTCSDEVVQSIEKVIESNKQVLSIDMLKTRRYGSKIYIDLEITLDKSLTFVESHDIAATIHDNVERQVENVKHCMVHVNPS